MAVEGPVQPDALMHFWFQKHKESEEQDKTNVICKMWKIKVQYCGNTTDLQTHFMRHHTDVQSAKYRSNERFFIAAALGLILNALIHIFNNTPG